MIDRDFEYFKKYVQSLSEQKDNDLVSKSELINYKFQNICLLNPYLTEKILNDSVLMKHIDITNKEGRAFEFTCLSKNKDYMVAVKAFFKWVKENNCEEKITQTNKNNVIVSAPPWKMDLLNYLIFEEKVEFNKSLEDLLKNNKKIKVLKLFEVRDLEENLSNRLDFITNKKIKI